MNVHVLPSYYVKVHTEVENLIRTAGTVYFDFETLDSVSNQPVGNKLAVLWVIEQGMAFNRRRKITVKTSSEGYFRKAYHAYSNDAGIFVYGGEHPTYNNNTEQGSFAIMIISISPQFYYFRWFRDKPQTIEYVFNHKFLGGSFSNITVLFDQIDDIRMEGILDRNAANFSAPTVTMGMFVKVSGTLTGRIYFTVSSNAGFVVSSSYVHIDVRSRVPILRVSPRACGM